MSELVRLRRADCGHGFLKLDVPPAAISEGDRELYFCEVCRRDYRSRIETKDVKAEQQRKAGR